MSANATNCLRIAASSKIEASNGGLFVSPAHGIHHGRIIDSYELILVRTGHLILGEADNIFALESGDTLILWPGKYHRGVSPYDPDTAFYWVHFHFKSAGRQLSGVMVPQHCRLQEPLRLIEVFHRFLDDQENKRLEADYAATLIKLMLFEIGLQSSVHFAPENQTQNLATEAQTLITRNFRQPLSTSLIANQLRCNPDYLGHVYRRAYGCNPTKAIHQARMKHAKNLLLLTSMNINEIASACGYQDIDYFRKIFRRSYDMQPRQFRHLHAKRHLNSA